MDIYVYYIFTFTNTKTYLSMQECYCRREFLGYGEAQMLAWLLQYQLQVHKSIDSDSLFNYCTLCLKAKELTDITFTCLNQVGIYLPCYDILRNWLEEFTAKNAPTTTTYVPLVAGSLARSLACTTCYPIELAKTRMQVFIR